MVSGDRDQKEKRGAEGGEMGVSTGQQRKVKLHSKSVVSKLYCLGIEISCNASLAAPLFGFLLQTSIAKRH